MKHEHNVIENQIFYSCREKIKEIEIAKQLLKENNYIVYKKTTRSN